MRFERMAWWWLLLCLLTGARVQAAEILVLEIAGSIGPATSDYVRTSLHAAADRGAELVVLRMDTPGGLDGAMRDIVKAILASPVPVAGYVAPSGARAASAGTYILYACHIAAMAPGTNLGAATPVSIGGLSETPPAGSAPAGGEHQSSSGTLKDKQVNDAAAYLRSLAQIRGRHVEWAERAVREAASLPAEEALALGVIDLMAEDLDALLARLHGWKVTLPAGERRLALIGLAQVPLAPDWKNRLLAVLSDPNVAYLLLLIGLYGLIYEFSNPGIVLPGIVGAVSLVLALYAFQLLPVNYAGAALMLLGLALLLAEAFVPSFGALGMGGLAAFVFGSLILIETDVPGFDLSRSLVGFLGGASALLLAAIVHLAVQSRRRPVVSGAEELPGSLGVALSGFPGSGRVRVHGEVWRATAEVAIAAGQAVRVRDRDGLVLRVNPVSQEEKSA